MTNSKHISSTIELWAPDRLVPYTRNARTHSHTQIDQIAASIEQFGFTNPILADTSSGILAGHARLLAAPGLGLKLVPVIVLDHLITTEKRACIIADHRLALHVGWDDTLRTGEIAALERDGCEIETRGFRDEDAALLTEHESADVIIRRWQEHTGKCATQEGDGRAFEEVVVRRLPELHRPRLRGGSRL